MLVECEPGLEDVVSTMLFESGFSGLEERVVEDRTRFTAFISPEPGADPLETFFAFLDRAGIDRNAVRVLVDESVPAADWEEKWREGLGAVETGRRIVVRPSWVDYDNRDERIEIIIDPKMAFGTGGHATTHLCLEALERFDLSGKSVLDAGCGSGVLSIAAAKLGAARAYGFDNDPFSVENANENILLNDVGDRVTIELADLSTVRPEPADIILANVISGVLIAHLENFRALLSPGGTVVFSGILAEEEERFTAALREKGFRVRSVEHRDEWIAVLAEVG